MPLMATTETFQPASWFSVSRRPWVDRSHRLPEARITDIMLAVDAGVGFTDAFTNFRTGAVFSYKLGLMNVLLAEGLN